MSICILCLINSYAYKVFRLVVLSSFVFANSNWDWLKYITWFISANPSCCLQKQMKIGLQVERFYSHGMAGRASRTAYPDPNPCSEVVWGKARGWFGPCLSRRRRVTRRIRGETQPHSSPMLTWWGDLRKFRKTLSLRMIFFLWQ